MPAIGLNDYLPAVDKFLQHWKEAEGELGRAIVLEDGMTRTDLVALRTRLSASQTTLIDATNTIQATIARREQGRKATLPVARQVRKAIRNLIPSSEEARATPEVPATTAGPEKQLTALRDIANLWTRVNALPANRYPSLTPPLIVSIETTPGVYEAVTCAAYTARVAALDSDLQTLRVAEQVRVGQVESRDKRIEQIKTATKAYARAIQGLFTAGAPTARSVPRLTR